MLHLYKNYRKNCNLLFRWLFWFCVFNLFVFFLINLSYAFQFNDLPGFFYDQLSWKDIGVGIFFFFIASFAQSSLFAAMLLIPLLLLALIGPNRLFVSIVGILFSVLMIFFLSANVISYYFYQMNFVNFTFQLFINGLLSDVLHITSGEYFSLGCLLLVIVLIEIVLVFWVWRFVSRKKASWKYFTLMMAGSLLISYSFSLLASTRFSAKGQILMRPHLIKIIGNSFIPYYSSILLQLIPDVLLNYLNFHDANAFAQIKKRTFSTQYPCQELVCHPLKKPYNIVIIALDAWRFDMFKKETTPHIVDFSKKAWVFKDHLSGGNCTGPGIFSLYYSIPANFFDQGLEEKWTPVFIDTLIKQHYQIGIFASGTLRFPQFDKLLFRKIHPLVTDRKGISSVRDLEITHDFKKFISNVKFNKPFFSYLFYDTTHNYWENPVQYPEIFKPATKIPHRLMRGQSATRIPYLNRYKNAIHFDDHLVGEVLQTLKEKKLLANTIVMITADHGEEFGESEQRFWGHSTAYNQWQTKVPFIIYWPGKQHKVVHYRTSHYDVMPTIMKDALGCSNPVTDYSIGQSLWDPDPEARQRLIINSYTDWAIVEPNRITHLDLQGNYRFFSYKGKPLNSHWDKELSNIIQKHLVNSRCAKQQSEKRKF